MVLAGQLHGLTFYHAGWPVHPGVKMEEGSRDGPKEVKWDGNLNEELGPTPEHPKFLRTFKSREDCDIEDGQVPGEEGEGTWH